MKITLDLRSVAVGGLFALVLGTLAAARLPLAANAFHSSAATSAQTGYVPVASRFLHDWMYSHGGSRHMQYDMQTGELLLVGEIAHGMDYFSGSGGFWWCSFGGHTASPILSFLMRESTVEYHDRPNYYPPGLGAPYTDHGSYSVIRLEPIASQKTFVNKANEGTDFPDNYTEIPNRNLEYFLYRNVDGTFNIAVMDAGIAQEIELGEAEGDGSSNRDNGVRMHIAFRAYLPLPAEKLEWTRFLDYQSEAYETEHPTGF